MVHFSSRVGLSKYRQPLCTFLIAAAIGSISCGVAPAQYMPGVGGEGISAAGTGQTELEPKKLRLNMWVEAKGKDAKSAAMALASHQERVRKDLVAMNAKAESVQFSAPRFTSGETDQGQSAMRMMRRQMGSVNLGEQDEVPEIVTARSALQVEWDLPTTDPQALAILPEGLKQQIVTRDLAGKENKPDLTEEEAEKLDEITAMMQENMGGFSYSGPSDGTEPKIVYVAEVDSEQRQAAMKQAFDQARQSAEIVSAAAGIDLGPLKSVVVNEQQIAIMRATRFTGYGGQEESPFAKTSPDEVTSATLEGLTLQLSLMAVYDL